MRLRNFGLLLLILLTLGYAETFEECRARLNTPAKIGYFVKHEIDYHYARKGVPYKTAQETFRSRMGGCTDKAQFAYEMLAYHGYTAGVYEMSNATRGHSFVVYLNGNGKYNSIDSIYGNQAWNRVLVTSIGQLIYSNFGGYTNIRYIKGYKKWDLRTSS